MQIGTIGSGLIGGTVARLAARAGHEVLISNSRGPETLQGLADEIGARAVTAEEAATAADIVVLSIPQGVVRILTPALFAATPATAAIVDTGNYYPSVRDGLVPEIEDGLLDSEWVQARIGRTVVKAFNMIKASSLAERGQGAGAAERIAISIAGDDAEAKTKVAILIDQIGFDVVDAGALSESWRMHPGTIGYCNNYDALTLGAALAAGDRSLIAQYRAASDVFARELVKAYGSVDAVGAARQG
ncbi:MAG: NAD(P)-binding domain-containing protein [Brevundimonas sp.]|uniref:NADPH-dependent F420 reductase n=1 Tax=Brevundimonas sp. TaxID=1871086 RepID=UPI0025831BCF|nr:NAD(P)-binding domain-containing protein [Brevundimonas sp.]MCV0413790.1 NAD(P)-binding domain-containing protein [Brevundimonas sp.]